MPDPTASPIADALTFPSDGGEAGAMMRALDWSRSPLGPPSGWSQSLRSVVELMLGSRFPMFVAWGPELGFLYNDAYAVILGAKHPKAMGSRFEDIWKEIWSDVGPLAQRALAGEATWLEDLPLVMNRKGFDEQTWFTFSYSPVRDDGGEIAGMFCAVAETTDKVLAERRLTSEAARQRRLFEQAPGFVIIMRGPDHVVEFVNDAHKRTFGSGDWEGREMREAFPSIEGQGFFERLDDVYRTGETYKADGVSVSFQRGENEPVQTRALTFIYAPLYDDDGNVSGIFCEGFDVTEGRLARVRDAALSALADVARESEDPEAIAYAAAEILGRAFQVSRAGYGTVDTVNETITIKRDWNAPGIASISGLLRFRDFGSYIDDLKAGRTVVVANAAVDPRTREGASRLKEISAQAFVNMPVTEQGDAVALLFLNHAEPREWRADELALIQEFAERTRIAVERRRAELALADTARLLSELNETLEQRVTTALADKKVYADIVESSAAAVTALDLDGRILAINRANVDAFESVYGKRPAVGDDFLALFADWPDHLEQQRAIWSRALAGEAFAIIQEFGDEQIERRNFEVRFSPLRDSHGTRIGASSTSYDVTDRIAAEAQLVAAQEQLREAQKMEAMGQLTGGVAHDFNNLLSPIVGSLDMLTRSGVGTEREKRLIAAAMQSADRARTLVQRLLAFARRQPLQATAVDVGSLVTGMAELISSTIGPHIKVSVEIGDEVPLAHADPNQLEMAILNLSVNARDAMPDGGSLTIAATAQKGWAKRPPSLPPGDYVKLSIADTGKGMDEAVRSRAIEPFFSTKGIGKGTGLGLSMVEGLARQLGGALSIESQPDVGTEVSLWLPASAASDERSQPRSSEVIKPHQAGTALVVDDEELVRLSTADMLTELGYSVVEASSAEEALDRVRLGVRPDVLVSDHLMPGMTGIDLARSLRSEHEKLKVLIVSGYAEGEGVPTDFARLAKPFRKDELSASLAAL